MTVAEEALAWQKGTKPDSWDDAAYKCVKTIYSTQLDGLGSLNDIRMNLNFIIDAGMNDKNSALTPSDFANMWMDLGGIAKNAAKNAKVIFYDDSDVMEIVQGLANVLVKKQKDYGSDNINRFGRLGLLVRLHDKVARLENLSKQNLGPQNESVLDNFMDVINYCAIGMMVEMDWFMLQLASVAEDIKNLDGAA